MHAQRSYIVKNLGQVEYQSTFAKMRTQAQWLSENPDAPDELWLLEHKPVYTLGQAASTEFIKRKNQIAVVQSNRGGEITYHGPGQQIAYLLVNLTRAQLGVRAMVRALEQALIDLLARYLIDAQTIANAPGVYVAGKKIAALGLRITRGISYHGLALNVDMDLAPFTDIEPCGLRGMVCTTLAGETTQLVDRNKLCVQLIEQLKQQGILGNIEAA